MIRLLIVIASYALCCVAFTPSQNVGIREYSSSRLNLFDGLFKSGGKQASKAPKQSPELLEALAIYEKKFGSAKEGTRYSKSENELANAFNTIATIYGIENALQMVKDVPESLTFKVENMQPSFDAFVANLGEEDSIAMVKRNPNLLGVRPTGYGGADKTGKDAFYLSYVVAATRPIGPFLLFGLFVLLSIPAVEILTGVPRSEFLKVFIN